MMKHLKRLIVLLLVIFFASLTFTYFKADAIKEALLKEIKNVGSNAIKGDFAINDVSISFFPVSFSLKDIHTKNESFDLTVKKINLDVEISKLIFGEVVITGVQLSEPKFSTITSSTSTVQPTKTHNEEKASLTPTQQDNSGLPLSLSLENVSLTHGSVHIAGSHPLNLDEISLSSKATFKDSLFSVSNVEIQGVLMNSAPLAVSLPRADFDLNSGKLLLSEGELSLPGGVISMNGEYFLTGNGSAHLSSKKLSLEELISGFQKLLPGIPDYSTSGMIAFDSKNIIKNKSEFSSKATLLLSDIAASAGDLKVKGLKGEATLEISPQLKLIHLTSSSLSLGGEEITLSTDIASGDLIRVDTTRMSGFGGSLTGTLTYAPVTSTITSSHTISGINLSRALASIQKPLPMSGTLSSCITKEFSLTPQLSSFSGSGSIALSDITLQKINILADVFKALQSIPGVSDSIRSKLSPLGVQALSSSDTALSKLTANFLGSGEKINVNSLSAQSPLFAISGSGGITPKSLSGSFSLTLDLSRELTAAIKASTPALSKMSAETISLPLTISIQSGTTTVLPNVEKLIETLGKEALKDVAKEALSQALSSKGGGKTKDLVKGLLGF